MTKWRKSTARQAVLDVLADENWHYVYDLMKTAEVRSGLMYRVLWDLVIDGTVQAKWAELEPGRKYRRRLYALRNPARRQPA